MRTLTMRRLRGFTLVELMIVVAIIGVLAALAIYGVSRYLRNAKTAEARSAIGAMAKGNISYFNQEAGITTVLAAGSTAGFSNALCDSASKTVPAGVASVKGVKYQSADSEWNTDSGAAGVAPKGFSCLRFSVDAPQYFLYNYTAVAPTTTTGTFKAIANGDLNGDGITSAFTLDGAVQNNRVTMAPSIAEISPGELTDQAPGSPAGTPAGRMEELTMAYPSRRFVRGFTLVELMIVVAIIGVLAALSIYGVSRYLAHSKTSEARSMLGGMAKGNIAFFNAEVWQKTTVLPAGGNAGGENIVCDSATKTVPASVPKGVKYQSTDSEWSVDSAGKGVGFACLNFSIGSPQFFLYDYQATSAATPNAQFKAIAHGDLNGDGVTSTFEFYGAIQGAKVTFAPSIQEIAPTE